MGAVYNGLVAPNCIGGDGQIDGGCGRQVIYIDRAWDVYLHLSIGCVVDGLARFV